MYHPSLDEVKKLVDQGNLVPVYCEINADLDTPVSAYIKIARPPYSFLLESVEGGERIARYSFIGTANIEPGAKYVRFFIRKDHDSYHETSTISIGTLKFYGKIHDPQAQ